MELWAVRSRPSSSIAATIGNQTMQDRLSYVWPLPRICTALMMLPIAALIVSCASSTRVSSGGGPDGTSGAASCAVRSTSQYLSSARMAFVGIMLPGRTEHLDGRDVLVSPARVRVKRYLKGSGPHVVTVVTGAAAADGEDVVDEDGIAPQAGQVWQIYATSRQMPYLTSICDGSKAAQAAA
jgi:hypothetical protein